jgi:hypothetical protein
MFQYTYYKCESKYCKQKECVTHVSNHRKPNLMIKANLNVTRNFTGKNKFDIFSIFLELNINIVLRNENIPLKPTELFISHMNHWTIFKDRKRYNPAPCSYEKDTNEWISSSYIAHHTHFSTIWRDILKYLFFRKKTAYWGGLHIEAPWACYFACHLQPIWI